MLINKQGELQIGDILPCTWCVKDITVTKQRRSAMRRSTTGNAFCDGWCNTQWYNKEKKTGLAERRALLTCNKTRI